MSVRDIIYTQLRPRFQNARADLLLQLLSPKPQSCVLDLGGGDGAFARILTSRLPLNLTVADIGPRTLDGLAYVALDDSDRLPFDDNSFDLVFCNSVIEHVTAREDLPETEWQRASLRRQIAFANEIRRVGRTYFVQTPHRWFPFETHSLLPFANVLSHRSTNRLLSTVSRAWPSPPYADWRLLDTQDMKSLFPDGRVHIESLLGLPKSLIAYRRD
jgi:Methyltransferase domain